MVVWDGLALGALPHISSRADLAARTDLVAPPRAGLTAPSRAVVPPSRTALVAPLHGNAIFAKI